MRSADGETDVPLMPHELWHSEATAMFFVIFEVPFSRRARLSATGFGPAAECSPSSEAGTRCFKTNHLRVLKRQGHGTAGQAARSISSKIISTRASASSSCRAALSEIRNKPPPEHQARNSY
jgi:hypothetical protein